MKEIKLQSLALSNFKGVRDLTVMANGQDVDVFGENATGKTTIADAYTWLLFGKDSRDRTDFSIKTLDEDGQPLHHLDHSVEGKFVSGDRPMTLKRVFHEVWTKKKGSPQATFTGHETKYYVDGVPSRKRDYDLQVMALVNGNENLFKLLSSPSYFNEVLDWKKRRGVLLKICGDISDADVIASDPELSDLPGLLGSHSIDDFRKIVSEQKKKINSELKDIPTRIDEANHARPKLEGSETDLKKEAMGLQQAIAAIDDQIAQIKSGGKVSDLRKEILELQGEQQEFRNNYQADLHKKIDAKRVEYYDRKSEVDKLNWRVNGICEQVALNKKKIIEKRGQADDLRHEWNLINSKEFTYSGETACPTCGQDLPTDQVEGARKHAEEHFNLDKANRLQEIRQQGKAAMCSVRELEGENERLSKELSNFQSDAKQKKVAMDALKAEMDDLKSGTKSILDDPEYQKLEKQIVDLQKKIHDLQSSTDDAVLAEEEKKTQLRTKLADMEIVLARFDQNRQIDHRIAHLETQEKDLAAKYEHAEYAQHLTDVFIETKVNLLESKINSKFRLARFKLFDRQVNGGLVEVCEMTYQGVPFSDLNNAARINVGIDVIDTLSAFYGLRVPIFIDNRESVVRLADTDAQVISLIVSAGDQKLRIEKKIAEGAI